MSGAMRSGEVERLLREHGVFVRRARHGDLWRIGSETVLISRDASDKSPHQWRNMLAEVRRALRAQGIPFDGDDQTDDEEENVADNVRATESERDAREARAVALGVHVARKRRMVEDVEGTADLASLAVLLGLTDDPAAAGAVRVHDVNGNAVDGPLMFSLTVETPQAVAPPAPVVATVATRSAVPDKGTARASA